MNKQQLITWLATHLEQWPATVSRAPRLDGWTWFVDPLTRSVQLGYDVMTSEPEFIDNEDWIQEKAHIALEPVEVEAMIDIETFDTGDDAITFQVAIIFFDNRNGIVKQEIWNLDFDEQFKAGRTVSASTVAFHLAIPGNALKALEDPDVVGTVNFIHHLTALVEDMNLSKVWAKGNMDFNVLRSLFADKGYALPWQFYQVRELRTLMSECGVKKGDLSHNALEDCIDQMAKLAECRKLISDAKSIRDAIYVGSAGSHIPEAAIPDSVLAKEAVLQSSKMPNMDNIQQAIDDAESGENKNDQVV